jgi:hypothetical protein
MTNNLFLEVQYVVNFTCNHYNSFNACPKHHFVELPLILKFASVKYGLAIEILTTMVFICILTSCQEIRRFSRIELPFSESGHCSRCLQIHISPTTQSFIMRLNSILYARHFHGGGERTYVRRSGLNSAEKLRAFCAQPLAVLFLRTPTTYLYSG